MNKELLAFQKIKEKGLLPLFYHEDPNICVQLVGALYQAGVRTIEFTNRGQKAGENFKVLVKEKANSMPDLLLGVGTIKNSREAKSFIEYGADFLVSPYFDAEVNTVAGQYNILWIPGCMTPTEIHWAQVSGCPMIKIFPGNVLGTGYLDAIMPIFPGSTFIITGGVDTSEENIRGWFKSGASGVALGSRLITKEILFEGHYENLQVKTRFLIHLIQDIKSGTQAVL